MPPDALAASLAGDAPAAAVEPVAPAPAAPEAPASAETTTKEPASRRDTIREAIAAQKERTGEPAEGRNPNAPLKTPPKAAAEPGERVRGADGKFAPAAAPAAPQAAAAAPAAPAAQAGDAPAPAANAEAAIAPPPGWSPASKVAFDGLPDHVKADIAKREREVNAGFAKLAEYKPVEKYAEMAKRGGTTLDRALEQYTGIETLLRRDVFAGVEQVLRNVGVNPVSFARAYLQRSGGPQNGPAPADPAARQPAAIDPQAIVRQATEAVRSEYEQRQAQAEIARFSADPKNRFFENVKPKMGELVRAGFASTVQEAYDMACRMDPEISRLINAPPAPDPRKLAADQARAAARATTGAPASGHTPAKPGLPENSTRRDVINAAIAAQRGVRA